MTGQGLPKSKSDVLPMVPLQTPVLRWGQADDAHI